MAYATSDIIEWANMSQALAAIGEAKKNALAGAAIDKDLHIKIYVEKKSLEWELADDASSDNLFQIGNWVYALCFPYVLQAQQETGDGGQIAPITPAGRPSPYYFYVSSSSFIVTGGSSKTISLFEGYNLIFTRNGIPQSTVVTEPSYFTWDAESSEFTCSPALVEGELIGLIPV
jgi:hypothetical protein